VFVEGTSFIPRIGNQTQKIPPITSVSDNKVSSAAGIIFEPIEYNIRPKHTIVPCVAKRASFLLEESIGRLLYLIIIKENKQQNRPAIATVVNFGVFLFHLRLIENIENPVAEANPKNNPIIEFDPVASKAIIPIPVVASIIETHTFIDISSFKNKKPNSAVMKGIAAKHRRVTAAVVCVIDHINVVIAIPKPIPPIIPAIPTLR
tara:strand:+ start:118 stop:732 length:615 start_codon:yes stop_codon:yes gene_type:complete